MSQKRMKRDNRTPEQIREHYEIEKELAGRLRNASKQERRYLYSSLYDELFRRVPHHPQLTRKTSPEETAHYVAIQIMFLRPYLNKDVVFVEVGPGDCTLSLEVAKSVKQVFAVDVSDEITKDLVVPENFRLILSDGISIPGLPNSVDVVYSYQLMEHLHVDDAIEQLQNIYHALAPGGCYICVTPNKWTGPHDVSRFFDQQATGFHLKEYTALELQSLFRKVGFLKIRLFVGGKGRYIACPSSIPNQCEQLLSALPDRLGKAIAVMPPFKQLLGIRIVGTKSNL